MVYRANAKYRKSVWIVKFKIIREWVVFDSPFFLNIVQRFQPWGYIEKIPLFQSKF